MLWNEIVQTVLFVVSRWTMMRVTEKRNTWCVVADALQGTLRDSHNTIE